MSDVPVETVAGWLPRARWFTAKQMPAGSLTVADAVPAGAGVVLALLDVALPAGPERFVVPCARGSGADAATQPAFAAWLVATILGEQRHEGKCGTFSGQRVAGVAPSEPPEGPVVPVGADASNTSFRLRAGGRALVVKLLRRCRPGVQPEVEVGEWFATKVPFADTPALCGWLEHAPRDGGPPAVLATVHEFVEGAHDAWSLLGGLIATTPAAAERAVAIAGAIGTLTARMHAALAARADVPAFAPRPDTPAARGAIAAAMRAHGAHVLGGLDAAAAGLSADLGRRLRAVAATSARLLARFDDLAAVPASATLIRVHGDYHLGQVLVRADDRPVVIDFEGEPGRPLDERRRFWHAAKDVAGMVRSFDYLGRHVAGGAGRPVPLVATLRERFLAAYAAGAAGTPWWPADSASSGRLLAAYVLDKAIYELAYELGHRPDWVPVPLAALEELAGVAAVPGA